MTHTSDKEQFAISSKMNEFKEKIKYQVENIMERYDDEDDDKKGQEPKRVRTTYRAVFLIKESILVSKDTKIIVQLDDGMVIKGRIELNLNPNP